MVHQPLIELAVGALLPPPLVPPRLPSRLVPAGWRPPCLARRHGGGRPRQRVLRLRGPRHRARQPASAISPYLPISPHISPYLPVLVLVTQQTASAAEIFAAALAHAGNALVLGTQTFGKGTSQAFVHLPGGHGLTFTVYSLAAGAASASHPLNDGVAPHVRWQWWSAVSTATAAADREIALAADAALRATSCSAAA